MTTVTKSIVIDAPREVLRPYFDEAEHVKQRSSNLYRWEPDEAWPNAGATCKVGFKATGIDVNGTATSLEYDPATLNTVYRIDSEGFEPSTWRYSFEERDGKTTVTAEVAYTVPGRILGPALDKLVVERGNAKLLQESLENLKAQVEDQV
jgi:hypothetical protein